MCMYVHLCIIDMDVTRMYAVRLGFFEKRMVIKKIGNKIKWT